MQCSRVDIQDLPRNQYSNTHTHACMHACMDTRACTHTHSYILEEGICYLALCEPQYPDKLAFSYLENLHKDFSEQHGHNVHKATRPYHFIEFGESCVCVCECVSHRFTTELPLMVPLSSGAEINRIKRNYQESQTRRSSQLRNLGGELQGVQKIMFENIDAALQRGELIEGNI